MIVGALLRRGRSNRYLKALRRTARARIYNPVLRKPIIYKSLPVEILFFLAMEAGAAILKGFFYNALGTILAAGLERMSI